VRRLADRAVDEATDALRPFGYYKPVIRSRTSFDEPNWIVRLKIEPGEPVKMREVDVRIDGPGEKDREIAAIPQATSLKPGTRLDHPAYEALKTSLLRTARDRGYLDATLTRRELIVNPTELTADARLTLETGERYEFGAIEVEQDTINDDLLQAYLRFDKGTAVLAFAAEQHAVRTGRQPVFFLGVGDAGRARYREPHRAGAHTRGAGQQAPLQRQRRLRYRYGCARPVHLGQPAGQPPRTPPADGADSLAIAPGSGGTLRHTGGRPEPRKTRIFGGVRRRTHWRPGQQPLRDHGRADPGDGALAASAVPAAQRRSARASPTALPKAPCS
jgi:hypothetical protein